MHPFSPPRHSKNSIRKRKKKLLPLSNNMQREKKGKEKTPTHINSKQNLQIYSTSEKVHHLVF